MVESRNPIFRRYCSKRCKDPLKSPIHSKIDIINAGDGIRTRERLRDRALNPAPLTWLGNPRSKWVLDQLDFEADLA